METQGVMEARRGNRRLEALNAVAYNEDLDQIALSSRFHDEIYIIDHSTTTEEAAGHTGGNSEWRRLLYRWVIHNVMIVGAIWIDC